MGEDELDARTHAHLFDLEDARDAGRDGAAIGIELQHRSGDGFESLGGIFVHHYVSGRGEPLAAHHFDKARPRVIPGDSAGLQEATLKAFQSERIERNAVDGLQPHGDRGNDLGLFLHAGLRLQQFHEGVFLGLLNVDEKDVGHAGRRTGRQLADHLLLH